jgi:hypothetical protein
MILLTLDRERCNKCRTMNHKFVIEEDDSKCLTRLLSKTEIRNSIVLTIIPTFEISLSLIRISYLKIRLHLSSLTLAFKSLSLALLISQLNILSLICLPMDLPGHKRLFGLPKIHHLICILKVSFCHSVEE